MSFIWDEKNNFILLHFINLHQQQSSTLDINWLSIVNDINLEICSTPILLKNQYENLLEIFYPKQDSKSLYLTLKHMYLHSLCQKIEDNLKLTLETVYELIRHARSKRINLNDIEQLIKEWNFNYLSDDQKKNKERLFDILNRLRDYIHTLPNNDYQPVHHYLSEYSSTNEPLTIIETERSDEKLEFVSDNEIPMTNKLILNKNEEKKSFVRRRTQSLTIFTENKTNKINIGVEWFVPKLKRQQRSSSLHTRYESSSSNQNSESNRILITTIDNDESLDSINNLNLRQTHTQPTISWLPLTHKQIYEKECQQIEPKFIDGQQLDPVSSTDSDSIEIQWSGSSNNKISETTSSSPSHDLHQQEHNSCKRQRLA